MRPATAGRLLAEAARAASSRLWLPATAAASAALCCLDSPPTRPLLLAPAASPPASASDGGWPGLPGAGCGGRLLPPGAPSEAGAPLSCCCCCCRRSSSSSCAASRASARCSSSTSSSSPPSPSASWPRRGSWGWRQQRRWRVLRQHQQKGAVDARTASMRPRAFVCMHACEPPTQPHPRPPRTCWRAAPPPPILSCSPSGRPPDSPRLSSLLSSCSRAAYSHSPDVGPNPAPRWLGDMGGGMPRGLRSAWRQQREGWRAQQGCEERVAGLGRRRGR